MTTKRHRINSMPFSIYFMLKFWDWVLISENTITQILRSRYRQEIVKAATDGALKYLGTRAWARAIPQENLNWYAKWAAYQWFRGVEEKPNVQNDPTFFAPTDPSDSWQNAGLGDWIRTANSNVSRFMSDNLDEYSDYIAAMFTDAFNVIRSKLNNPNYTVETLRDESEQWHTHIASRKRQPGPEGRSVPLPGMPAGWQWISLDKEYCKREGEAMGHCGNAGFKAGDNIYSLRDAKGVAHLTFIVNNGVLGESKGFGNQKPTKPYHQMIIAFLLGDDNGKPIVDYIGGGGYEPENNFHFEDLNKEQQTQVLKIKPYIKSYMDFLKFKSQSDPNAAKKYLDDDFGFDFEKIDFDKNLALVKSWNDIIEMTTWLKDNTRSELKELPDLDSMDWDFQVDTGDAIKYFNSSANKQSETMMEKIIEKLKMSLGAEDEDEDYDVRWAVKNEPEITRALRIAAEDGLRYGAESDAYQSVVRFFDKEQDESGFDIVRLDDGNWQLRISLDDLMKLHTEFANSGAEFGNLIEFKYSAPYNGYSGFDDNAYNERLQELLKEVEDMID